MLDSRDSQRGDLFLGLALLGQIVNLLIALDLQKKIYQDKQTKINVHDHFSPRSKMTETTKWEKILHVYIACTSSLIFFVFS